MNKEIMYYYYYTNSGNSVATRTKQERVILRHSAGPPVLRSAAWSTSQYRNTSFASVRRPAVYCLLSLAILNADSPTAHLVLPDRLPSPLVLLLHSRPQPYYATYPSKNTCLPSAHQLNTSILLSSQLRFRNVSTPDRPVSAAPCCKNS